MTTKTEQATATATGATPDLARLEESFRLFTETTRGLESAYNALNRRAARIDVELKRSNDELRDKIQELEALSDNRMSILQALPSGVVVLDAGGFVSCVNPAAERILGRRALELLGRSARAVVGPTGDRLLVDEEDGGAGRRGIERELVTMDGSRRHVSYTIAALPDGGQLQVLNDLTVVTRLREQIGRLDTLAALGEMAAGVAHEIRNPLNGIDGFAGLLERALERAEADPATLARYAEKIRRGVREVNDIITNLLTFAAQESINPAPVPLADLIEEVVEELAKFGPRDAARPRITGNLPALTIPGDPVKLKIVLTNLVRNAIEAAGPEGRVEVALERAADRKRALVRIEDDGGGLPEEVRSRLFRPFTTTKASGTGLGLAIANKFAALHGGEITFKDIPGGTAFTVALPVNDEGRI
ncbi:MAG: PAS domain-containing protein [Planctomycetes bacterium]|nr:PAS domain-containing protein [Planctomycetota bacterium]